MKNRINQVAVTLTAVVLLASCTAAKVAVPDAFKSQATEMKVKGINGFTINQTLSFGEYKTSKIKRGWDFSGGLQFSKFNLATEEMVLQVFDIGTDKKNYNQRNKFQYTITDGNLVAGVFAQERFSAKELVYRSKNPVIGDITKTNSFNYSFGAAIIPQSAEEPWALLMTQDYNRADDAGAGIFDRPAIRIEGYATNNRETIEIRSLMISSSTGKKGKESKIFGGPMLSGYELSIEGAVIGVVDILDNTLWVYKELDQPTKLIVSSIASAILLKRMQDAARDRADEN